MRRRRSFRGYGIGRVTVAIRVVTVAVGIVGAVTVTVATGVLTATVAAIVGADGAGTETDGGNDIEGNSDGAPLVVDEATEAETRTDPEVGSFVESCADVGARTVPAPAPGTDGLAER